MTQRELPSQTDYPDLVLRTRPNWTAAIFVALLAGLHFGVSISALLAGRFAGYLSLVFACLLSTAAILTLLTRGEVILLHAARTVRTRTGIGRRFSLAWRNFRYADFAAVRVTLGPHSSQDDSLIELVSVRAGAGDVMCPPSRVPRQQALLMAMMLRVPLIKAWDEPRETGAEVPVADREREISTTRQP
jgi:hypothetical protein